MEEKILSVVRFYQEDATTQTRLDSLGLDSLDWLELGFEIEDAIEETTNCCITIPDAEFKKLYNGVVADLVNLAETLVKN